jgi:4-amino-4-deoxy-L-arabinose transferase-like glycosyltransferase
LAQIVFIITAIYLNRGNWLYSDNTFYETPAWNLASGHGFSIPREQWEDPYLTGLYHSAHTAAANSPDVPAVVFPPGYGYFLGAVYAVAGRNELAAVVVNGLMVLAALVCMFVLVRRAFGERLEAIIALGLIAIFPMWAFWAARIMSDTLHLLLVLVFAVIWFVDNPSVRRTILAGLFLGLASLTRPYTALLPLAFGAGWLVFRLPAFSARKALILAVITWSVVGLWTARNYYYFNKPIVVTSMGLGYGLLVGTYEYADLKTGDLDQEMTSIRNALGLEDYHQHDNNARFLQIALERIRQHPAEFALACLRRIPGLWVSLGKGMPRPAAWALTLYFGALLATMLYGMFLLRRTRNVVLAGSIIIVLYYWMVFIPLNGEGRYMLTARPFALLLSAVAIAALLRRLNLLPMSEPEELIH